jgi:prepilin-type N-terminal cleavage/methylation domain-containing protein
MKNFRKMWRGQKGFTLIELLVVIIILGVLAAVVTLSVTQFIGKGAKESANAEAQTLITAIESTIASANSGVLVLQAATWNGTEGTSPYIVGTSDNGTATNYYVSDQYRTHQFKASYTISTSGAITAATNDSWGQGLLFNATSQKWYKP